MVPSDYERLRPLLLAYFRRRLRDTQEAEDLCQETLLRAVQAADALRQTEKLQAYVYQVARNVLINHLRRRNVVMSASRLGDDVDIEQVADSRALDPEAGVRWGELQGRVSALLETMPAEHRRAFELGVVQRMVYSEIAAVTGWSISKVKINVYRARKLLIDRLHEYRDASGRETS